MMKLIVTGPDYDIGLIAGHIDKMKKDYFHGDDGALSLNYTTEEFDPDDPLPKLGDRNYLLLSDGAKTCGANAEDIIAYCFEQMYCSEATILIEFIRWCEETGSWFGRGNYEEVFAQFKNEKLLKDNA